MWKVLLADDEEVILHGLKRLVEWDKFNILIVGEATDGKQALEMIRTRKPDIVITDVKMPKMSGIEVLEAVEKNKNLNPKFVFISAYQEFDYVKAALSRGAVDYLLKPVRKKDLEDVLQKTINQLQDQSTINIFREDREKDGIQQIFQNINDGYEYAESDLYLEFSKMDIDVDNKFYVGICFGMLPGDYEGKEVSYEKYKLLKFVLYNKIQEYFKNDNRGFVIRKDDNCCNLIGVMEDEYKETFIERYIEPLKAELETEYAVHLCVGIGERTKDINEINTSYTKAKYAYDLYYFEEQEIIDIKDIVIPEVEEYGGIDAFNKLSENVFGNIAAKDENMLQSINQVLDLIKEMHYGNRYAAVNLCLVFSGNLLERLHSYDMVHGSFSVEQEAMLEKMQEQNTYRELKAFLLNHYAKMMNEVYANVQNKDVAVIVQVKEYLHANYMNEISLKDLADMVCVSPSYFSTFFKNTTGENYKSYLIKIRMEEAIKLVMNTDLKTYEIAERVGYNNVRRFVDAFKNKYRMSPMDYRKLYKKSL